MRGPDGLGASSGRQARALESLTWRQSNPSRFGRPGRGSSGGGAYLTDTAIGQDGGGIGTVALTQSGPPGIWLVVGRSSGGGLGVGGTYGTLIAGTSGGGSHSLARQSGWQDDGAAGPLEITATAVSIGSEINVTFLSAGLGSGYEVDVFLTAYLLSTDLS